MTKKKKIAILVTSLALTGALLIGGTLAYFTDKDEAQNVFTLGKVDGKLEEPEWDVENPDGEIENVQPGDKITKDPTLTLATDSEDAYARFQITYNGITPAQFEELIFLKDNVEVTFDADGYFYVQTPLKADESFVLFDEVVIPETWGNEMAETRFEINIVAELIQAKNFEDSENLQRDDDGNITGWGNVTIEELR